MFHLDGYTSTFEELLEKDKSLTVHLYDIQALSTELSKVHNNLPQTIFGDLLVRNPINYNLRSQLDFVIPQVKTVFKGSNSLQYFGPIIEYIGIQYQMN